MATYVRKSDPMVLCPYNSAHLLLKSRMQTHLVKCKKEHMDIPKKVCVFNAQHIINPENYELHISICPNRDIVERQLLVKENEHQGAIVTPAPSEPYLRQSNELWDIGDEPVPGYQPKKGYILDLAHLKPAEKKRIYKSSFDDSEGSKIDESASAKPEKHVNPSKILKDVKAAQPSRRIAARFTTNNSTLKSEGVKKLPIGRGGGIPKGQ